ncbi:MAG: Fis family transcriptional regulator [Cytophagales bacterium CG12_big_fil_rev_8_21_14_0_65_40_12]|nr:MAG: Fis family transcriptional regulator [Cytophagales bacterium CG12_big_fil_rev_8_21_14_0_65_40_12]PIW04400.1 MAG: Fis family transcriptional regulator [Cytophagales bacterium CG17_big_fil_post_rev_8_21_14_2_50_40_13]
MIPDRIAEDEQQRLSFFTIEHALASIFWMDQSGKIVYANATASQNYGYSREEFLSMFIYEINRNFSESTYKNLWSRFEDERQLKLESTHWTKSGDIVPVDVYVHYLEFEGKAYNISFVLNISERKRKEKLLMLITENTTAAIGDDYFKSLVENVTKALGVRMSIVTECMDTDRTRLRTLAYYREGQIKENIEYDLAGTPCQLILETNEPYYQKKGVKNTFPREATVEGYLGLPINSRQGQSVGHLAIFSEKELEITDEEIQILKTLAQRASLEIERNTANEKLLLALQEVESLKDRLEAENSYLQQEIKIEHNFEEIISQSPKFKLVLNQVEQVAKTDATVLVLGESGTGKELLSRAIHNISNRKKRPLVKVNCASLPANLIESELFGHERGAFTGAVARKSGRFELADGGTIFLDEIGELPIELQAKLLRALQEGEFERVGGTKTIKVNVRIIAATNRDLEAEVAEGRFRADLYYRLNVFPIHSIPLRDRKEDIPLLVKHFVDKYSGQMGKRITNISKRVITSLQAYDWPGNIRELENVIERALIVSQDQKLELGGWMGKKDIAQKDDALVTLAQHEKAYILKVLHETTWRVSGDQGAAKILGMKPTTLESRMKKLGIKRGR